MRLDERLSIRRQRTIFVTEILIANEAVRTCIRKTHRDEEGDLGGWFRPD